MATLQIGRVGIDVAWQHVEAISVSGQRDLYELKGTLKAASLADAKVLRDQLLGHAENPFEPEVPVVWSEDSSLNGYYRVRDPKVDYVHTSLVSNLFPYSVRLERAVGQVFDTVSTGFWKTNVHSITGTVVDFAGYPTLAAAKFFIVDSLGAFNTSPSVELRPSALGASSLGFQSITGTMPAHAFSVDPAHWYDGACRLEYSLDNGSTYRTWVGGDELPTNEYWRITNDGFRISPLTGTNNTRFLLEAVTAFSGSATWESTTVVLQAGSGASSPVTVADLTHQYVANTVLWNGPSEVRLRLFANSAYSSGNVQQKLTVDVRLRRGARHAELYMVRQQLHATEAWSANGIRALNVTNMTGHAGYADANSNDANGNKLVLMSPATLNTDTTNGKIRTESDTGTSLRYCEASFGAGIVVDGSSATGQATAANMALQYMSGVFTQYRAVRL